MTDPPSADKTVRMARRHPMRDATVLVIEIWNFDIIWNLSIVIWDLKGIPGKEILF